MNYKYENCLKKELSKHINLNRYEALCFDVESTKTNRADPNITEISGNIQAISLSDNSINDFDFCIYRDERYSEDLLPKCEIKQTDGMKIH